MCQAVCFVVNDMKKIIESDSQNTKALKEPS